MALTKCSVPTDVIGSLGTTVQARGGITTQQFKDKFDEMPEGIKSYLNDTLTEEIDTNITNITEDLSTHTADTTTAHGINTKVSKTGDTITGNIDLNNSGAGSPNLIFSSTIRSGTIANSSGVWSFVDTAGPTNKVRIGVQSGDIMMLSGVSVTIKAGTGTPEGVVTAPVGSLFLRTDGGAGTTLYVKQSGTGNTGWVGK